MEEYLTTYELSKRIKYTPASIRNLVYKDIFKKDIHYLKPTSRKLLFVWSAVESWLHGDSVSTRIESADQHNSLINI